MDEELGQSGCRVKAYRIPADIKGSGTAVLIGLNVYHGASLYSTLYSRSDGSRHTVGWRASICGVLAVIVDTRSS